MVLLSGLATDPDRRDEAVVCRSCGSSPLAVILDLGTQPLANGLRAPDAAVAERRYPLRLALCERCSLVQITVAVPPEEMFTTYPYFSSVSAAVVRHAQENVQHVMRRRPLRGDCLAIEIGSNDGYLLQHYRELGIPVLGIEPATNIAAVANANGIPTECEFFGTDLAARLVTRGVRADVIHANNVLAHMPDINDVVEAFALLLKDDGRLVIETPYVKDLIDRCEFDTIYHEHVFYYSLTSLQHLFAAHGLIIEDVRPIDFHGGSLRLTATPAAAAVVTPAVTELLAAEEAWGARDWETYSGFAAAVGQLGEDLRAMITDLAAQGCRIVAYGAAAKGATLLNTFGLGHPQIEYVVDRSPHKQGLVMPGAGLAIHPPERLVEDRPDYVLLLTWNLADEILEQQHAYRELGGHFIIPIPTPRVV